LLRIRKNISIHHSIARGGSEIRELTPAKAEEIPAEKRPDFIKAYQKQMDETIALIDLLKKDVADSKLGRGTEADRRPEKGPGNSGIRNFEARSSEKTDSRFSRERGCLFLSASNGFRCSTKNPPVEIACRVGLPREPGIFFRRACADCHSNDDPSGPGSSRIAPVSWFVRDHVVKGREDFNIRCRKKLRSRRDRAPDPQGDNAARQLFADASRGEADGTGEEGPDRGSEEDVLMSVTPQKIHCGMGILPMS